MRLRVAALNEEYAPKEKLKELFGVALNVTVTGLVVHYVVNHRDFISYGLFFYLVKYYIEWLIQAIKRPGEG